MNIETAVERFIFEELRVGNRQTNISPDGSLVDSGVLDSLALLRLILFIEEQYGVTVENGEVIPDNFQTVNHIKAFVERKIQAHCG